MEKAMKVLLLGGTGMLGHKLGNVLAPRFETYITVRRQHPALATVISSRQLIVGVAAEMVRR